MENRMSLIGLAGMLVTNNPAPVKESVFGYRTGLEFRAASEKEIVEGSHEDAMEEEEE